jgi:type I restriction enzyme S subunit
LGNIPAHWQMIRSGYLFREVVDTGHSELELLSIDRFRGIIRQSDIGRKERASKDRSSYKRIRNGQLGYNLMNAFNGSIGISQYDGIISPAYAVGQPQKEMIADYYHHLYRSPIYAAEINRYSYGIMYERNRLYYDYFKKIPVPYPPIEEQRKIVAVIHQKNREFQNLISVKRCRIKLLNEQKQVIIRRTVTRGLDPNVRLKPSGIEWLRDVPEHWQIQKLKYVTKMIVGGSTPSTTDLSCWNGDIVWITPEDVSKSELLTTSSRKITQNGVKNCSTVIVPKGSIIITSRAPVGNVAVADIDLCTNQGCKSIIPDLLKFDTSYGYFLLKIMQLELQNMSKGTTFYEISTFSLANVKIPLPPLKEQQIIVESLKKELDVIENSIKHTVHEIDLVREYRTRLISDIVTGKVDLRRINISDDKPLDQKTIDTDGITKMSI